MTKEVKITLKADVGRVASLYEYENLTRKEAAEILDKEFNKKDLILYVLGSEDTEEEKEAVIEPEVVEEKIEEIKDSEDEEEEDDILDD